MPWARHAPLTKRIGGARYTSVRPPVERGSGASSIWGAGEREADLSPHLRSRHKVGHILRAAGVEVIEFRASIVIGSGSFSFEMIRALVEWLPVMVMPRWVRIPAQPIAISDLVQYLLQALTLPLEGHPIFEIGGRDQVSYGDIMRTYARQRNLCRLMLPVPALTPRLSSLGWRVEAVEADHRLRLVAEMRLPGRAWLEFEVDGDAAGSTIRQTAMLDPIGLLGLLYWYTFYPFHQMVFAGLSRSTPPPGPSKSMPFPGVPGGSAVWIERRTSRYSCRLVGGFS